MSEVCGKIVAGGACESLTFVWADTLCWTGELRRGRAKAYLDEHQSELVQGDQVDLAETALIVALDDSQTGPPEVIGRMSLSGAAEIGSPGQWDPAAGIRAALLTTAQSRVRRKRPSPSEMSVPVLPLMAYPSVAAACMS